jgi:chromosome segregation ATPase
MLRLSSRLPKTSQTQTQPSPPKYDPSNSESVDEYIKRLQSTIDELETALGVARVNLAAEEDSERKAELVKQLHSNQRQLENAKVELVTAKASTMNGSDEG